MALIPRSACGEPGEGFGNSRLRRQVAAGQHRSPRLFSGETKVTLILF